MNAPVKPIGFTSGYAYTVDLAEKYRALQAEQDAKKRNERCSTEDVRALLNRACSRHGFFQPSERSLSASSIKSSNVMASRRLCSLSGLTTSIAAHSASRVGSTFAKLMIAKTRKALVITARAAIWARISNSLSFIRRRLSESRRALKGPRP